MAWGFSGSVLSIRRASAPSPTTKNLAMLRFVVVGLVVVVVWCGWCVVVGWYE